MTKYQVYKSTPEDRDIYRPPIFFETHIREKAELIADQLSHQLTEGCVYIQKVEEDGIVKLVGWRRCEK